LNKKIYVILEARAFQSTKMMGLS